MRPRVCDTVSIVKSDVSADIAVDGRRSRWAAHRVARREQLIDAAVRSIARHGAGVGLDEIAADAHTSKPVIYRYFADKTDLYRSVTQRVVGTIIAALRSVTAETQEPQVLIRRSVDGYLELLEHNPQLYRFVIAHPYLEAADSATSPTFGDVIAELLGAELASSLAARDLDPAGAHPWAEAIVGFISSASLWWLDNPAAMSRAQMGEYLAGLLWGGAAGVLQPTSSR
jgi:AcrR family transcriptional regulator